MIKYGSKIYVLCGAIFSLVGFPFLSIGLNFATHMDELGGTGSGNIKVDAAVAEYHLGTGSGNIKVRSVGASERIDMGTGSGSSG